MPILFPIQSGAPAGGAEQLQATSTSVSTTQATLRARARLVVASTSISTTVASLHGHERLSAASTSISTTNAALRAISRLQATSTSISTTTATLQSPGGRIVAASTSVSTTAATLRQRARAQASSTSISTTNAVLRASVRLQATSTSISVTNTALGARKRLSAVSTSVSTTVANLRRPVGQRLQAASTTISTTAARLRVPGAEYLVAESVTVSYTSATLRAVPTYVPAFTSRDTEVDTVFVVDGVEIPFIKITHTGADSYAASEMTVILAIIDLDQVPPAAPCHLNYIVDGEEIRRFTGRVAEIKHIQTIDQNNRIDDAIEVGCIGLLADAAAIAPKALTVLYDPDLVGEDELRFDESALPTDDVTNLPLYPVLIPITGLTAHKVLDRIGTEMGYTFIKRFADYRVDRVDVSPRDGWYAAAEQVLEGIETLRDVDDFARTISIDDEDRPVWSGMTALQVGLSDMLPTVTVDSTQIVNTLEMDYDPSANRDGDGIYYQYIFRPKVSPFPETGVLYQQSLDYVRLTRSLDDDEILAEDILYSEKKMFNADNLMVYREVTTQTMSGPLKIKHVKDVWALVPKQDGSGDMYLENIRHEAYGMSWVARKGVWSLQMTHNSVDGAIAIIEDPNGGAPKYRALDTAIRGSEVTPFEAYDITIGSIEEEFEFYDIVDDSQYNATVTKLDMLSQQRQGGFTSLQSGQPPSVSMSSKNRTRRTRTFEHAGSIAAYGRRKAESYGAGRLPYRLAKPAAQRRLARLAGWLPTAGLDMPTPVYKLRKGWSMEITDTTGNRGIFRVRSYEEVVENHAISQTIQLSKAVE